MSFLGKLFGADEAISSTVDAVSSGLDKLVYTDQEKSEAAAKERSEARSLVVEWMAATQGQNLSRRLIALSIIAVWLFGLVAATIIGGVAIFVATEDLMALAQLFRDMSTGMNGVVMLIIAFYFAAPHMGDLAQAAIGKFKQQTRKG